MESIGSWSALPTAATSILPELVMLQVCQQLAHHDMELKKGSTNRRALRNLTNKGETEGK
jgi:hypothetical protein